MDPDRIPFCVCEEIFFSMVLEGVDMDTLDECCRVAGDAAAADDPSLMDDIGEEEE